MERQNAYPLSSASIRLFGLKSSTLSMPLTPLAPLARAPASEHSSYVYQSY